jgi:hypothetical protein
VLQPGDLAQIALPKNIGKNALFQNLLVTDVENTVSTIAVFEIQFYKEAILTVLLAAV